MVEKFPAGKRDDDVTLAAAENADVMLRTAPGCAMLSAIVSSMSRRHVTITSPENRGKHQRINNASNATKVQAFVLLCSGDPHLLTQGLVEGVRPTPW